MYQRRWGFEKINSFFALLLVSIWLFELYNGYKLSMVKSFYDNFPTNVIGAVGGTYIIWMISKAIAKWKTVMTNFLVWCGRNSMTFLCLHLIDLDIPIRRHLGIHDPILVILFSFMLCTTATCVMYYITFFRKVYHITM